METLSAAREPETEYVDVCAVDELLDGDMEAFDVGCHEVLVVCLDGQLHAYDGRCPHQSASLVEGKLSPAGVLTCPAHRWQFDARCGKGVNPKSQYLRQFPIKIEGRRVLVGTEPAAMGGAR